MAEPIQQIYIIVHIDNPTTVTYSYVDPNTNKYVTTNVCDLMLFKPSCCMFVLDAASTSNGWTITQILPNRSESIDYQLGPRGLSALTLGNVEKFGIYRYFIVYFNTLSNATYFIDPQEVNIPPMGDHPR
ncbi:hypothetical protein [Duganella sp. S19_KUP01_CR8]|uniref:hypothetical protein n=1 Tax=Duganella sp. S19_KUP01_CR8 TaxID=3025502 RepID=UPI002FCD7B73